MIIYKQIKHRYNKHTNNIIRAYVKHNGRMANLKASTTFLIKCRQSGLIPRFISDTMVNIYNIFTQSSGTSVSLKRTLHKHIYNFQFIILKLLIQHKHKQIFKTQEKLNKLKSMTCDLLNEDDSYTFMKSEETTFGNMMKEHQKRLNLKLEKLMRQHRQEIKMNYNEDWFVNKTEREIPENVKWLLSLGPKFALPYKGEDFPIVQCIADVEQCIQNIEEKEKQEISRTKFVTLLENHKTKKMKPDSREIFILNTLQQTRKFIYNNQDMLILNSDKGNKTVAMEKKDYDLMMKKIIGDMCTYRRLKRDPTYNLQTKNNSLVDKLHKLNLIDISMKNKLTTKIANAPRIYGLPKIHKKEMALRPICSSINSPSYELCKYLVDILKHLTKNSIYNVTDAKDFKNRIENTEIEDDEVLVSFDVVSLFPSIPVGLAFKIIEEKWEILEKHTKIPKDLFMNIITFCIKDCRYFKHNNNTYGQTRGMPMGSPASPVIADIIMEELLHTTIGKMETKPRKMTKYVDDLFAIVKNDKMDKTLDMLNSFHKGIKFTMEIESDKKLPYLDTMVIRKGNIIKLNWYQKPMASGRLINFYSKHPKNIIINTATNFIDRVLDTSSIEFHGENEKKIYNILRKNDFPGRIIGQLVKRMKTKKKTYMDKSSKEQTKTYTSIGYIPGLSERIKSSDIYNRDKYILAMKTNNTTRKLFSNTKSKIDKMDEANVVYGITCNGDDKTTCQKVYVGTTKTKLKTRLSSHKSDLKSQDKEKSFNQKTALAAHCAKTGHKPAINNVKILEKECNYNKRYMKEMLHIINIPIEKRINYKTDTDNCAHIYRHIIEKYRTRKMKKAFTDIR